MSELQFQINSDEEADSTDQQCPVCSKDDFLELKKYSHEQWKIARCSSCKFVYLRNPPGYEAMIDDFAWEKTSKLEIKRRMESRPLVTRLSRNSRWRLGLFGRSYDKVANYFPSGNILDIGCGVGGLKIGEDAIPFGIELSRSLHSISNTRMKKKGGYVVHAAAIDGVKQFENDFFDGVVMFSYLEHEQYPREVLQQVYRILKPGSRAYVRVPNFGSINRMVTRKKWCGFRYPDHTNYFTANSLKQLATGIGFKYSMINTFSSIFNDNITALLIKQ